ncbi:MAG TPA: hypothetical protein ENN60_02145 [archaeon]|nr:hypothetical protein [archaeon]
MTKFTEWGIQAIVTYGTLAIILIALIATQPVLIRSFLSILASVNIITGMFSKVLQAAAIFLGASG